MCRRLSPPGCSAPKRHGHTKVCRTARFRGSSGQALSEAVAGSVARRAAMPQWALCHCAMVACFPFFLRPKRSEKRKKKKGEKYYQQAQRGNGKLQNLACDLASPSRAAPGFFKVGRSERTFGGDSGTCFYSMGAFKNGKASNSPPASRQAHFFSFFEGAESRKQLKQLGNSFQSSVRPARRRY